MQKSINSEEEFNDYLLTLSETTVPNDSTKIYYPEKDGGFTVIDSHTFQKLELVAFSLDRYKFQNCQFIDCVVQYMHIAGCLFSNAEFINATIYASHFNRINFSNVKFIKSNIDSSIFYANLYPSLRFDNCELYELLIRQIQFEEVRVKIEIEKCIVEACSFVGIPFKGSLIKESKIFGNSFSNCTLNETNIHESNLTPDKAFNTLDFFTIKNSSILPSNILKVHFGINQFDVKEYVAPMLSEIKFRRVFISYSDLDREFARKLSEALFDRGVINYLFEKHALPGESIEQIMREKQREFDRLLFIASKNSLKSRPCHIELTEARRRQNESWEEVFVPVMIDDYIFKVEKHQILDEDNREEFWRNISNLKKFVFQDFSTVKDQLQSSKEWDRALDTLIEALKFS